MMNMDGLILAGGKSTRMGGHHKGALRLGEETFTERLAKELKKEAEQVWISYGETVHECCEGCRIVRDIHPGCGPIGGLHAGLWNCQSDGMIVAACDMPFLKAELFRYLEEEMERAEEAGGCLYDGAVPVLDGKLHPLAAIYRKSALPVLENQIAEGDYRIMNMLPKMKIQYVDVREIKEFRKMLRNVNTLPEYERIAEE